MSFIGNDGLDGLDGLQGFKPEPPKPEVFDRDLHPSEWWRRLVTCHRVPVNGGAAVVCLRDADEKVRLALVRLRRDAEAALVAQIEEARFIGNWLNEQYPLGGHLEAAGVKEYQLNSTRTDRLALLKFMWERLSPCRARDDLWYIVSTCETIRRNHSAEAAAWCLDSLNLWNAADFDQVDPRSPVVVQGDGGFTRTYPCSESNPWSFNPEPAETSPQHKALWEIERRLRAPNGAKIFKLPRKFDGQLTLSNMVVDGGFTYQAIENFDFCLASDDTPREVDVEWDADPSDVVPDYFRGRMVIRYTAITDKMVQFSITFDGRALVDASFQLPQ